MKFKFLLIIFITFLANNLLAQEGEYNYFTLELGVNHTFSKSPDTLFNRFIQTGNGDIPVFPVKQANYAPGVVGGLLFHHDAKNDKIGFAIGAEYNIYSQSALYQSLDNQIKIKERLAVTALDFPLIFKFSPEMYRNQFYFYFGAKYSMNIGLKSFQTLVSDNNRKLISKHQKDECIKYCVPIIFGLNFKFINIRLNYVSKNFLNKDYQMIFESNCEQNQESKIYEKYSKSLFYITTAFNIPLSRWTTRHSYFVSRIFKH